MYALSMEKLAKYNTKKNATAAPKFISLCLSILICLGPQMLDDMSIITSLLYSVFPVCVFT